MTSFNEQEIIEYELKERFDEVINALLPFYSKLKEEKRHSLEFLKISGHLGRSLLFKGAYEQADECFRNVVEISGFSDDPETLRWIAMAYHYLGTIQAIKGNKQAGKQYLYQAKRIRESISDKLLWSTLNNLASIYGSWMEFTQAILTLEDALKSAMDARDYVGILLVLANLARIVFLRGDHETAETYLTQFQEILTQHVNYDELPKRIRAWLTFIDAEINQFKGNISDAMVKYQHALRGFEEVSTQVEAYQTLNRVSSCFLLRGQPYQAYMLVYRAIIGIVNQNVLVALPSALYMQGQILLEMQQYGEALKSFMELEKIARSREFQYHEAMACYGKARAYWSLENVDEALKTLEKALELWKSYDYPILDQAELFFYYAGILTSLGRYDEAVLALNSASNLLSRCTYQPIIHRVLNSYFKGYYFFKKGLWNKAIQNFEESLNLSIRIDQFNMVVKLCYYLIRSYLSLVNEHVNRHENGGNKGCNHLDKALKLLDFLRRVLISSEPAIYSPEIDTYDLKTRFLIYVIKGDSQHAINILRTLQTHIQLYRLPHDVLEIYQMRTLVHKFGKTRDDMIQSVLYKAMATLSNYQKALSHAISKIVGLLECSFCGYIVILEQESWELNAQLKQITKNGEKMLKCPYCMASSLDVNSLIIPKAVDVSVLSTISEK